MPILNYTTSVSVDRSIAEIQKALAKAGAETVSIEYARGTVSAVRFTLRLGPSQMPFRLPCNVDGVLAALKAARVPRPKQNADHAARVAWRIVKDWTEAQLALVEAQQAQLAEVFLPYAVSRNGQTAFQIFEANAQKLLCGDVE